MMVLVDTSVWVRALAGLQPFALEAAKLIRRSQVTAHELVYGEVLMGDVGGRQEFLTNYDRFLYAGPVAHHEVVALARARHLHGRGISWTDVHILASALAGRVQLWTADKRLAVIAEECGVAYHPSSE